MRSNADGTREGPVSTQSSRNKIRTTVLSVETLDQHGSQAVTAYLSVTLLLRRMLLLLDTEIQHRGKNSSQMNPEYEADAMTESDINEIAKRNESFLKLYGEDPDCFQTCLSVADLIQEVSRLRTENADLKERLSQAYHDANRQEWGQ